MILIFVLLCFTVACAQLAAMFAILFRYAIPRSPGFFHLLCVPALLVGVVALFSIGFMSLLPEGTLFLGLDITGWRITFLASQLITWVTLDLYAVYHVYRVRRERAAREIQEQNATLVALDEAQADRESRAAEVQETLEEKAKLVKEELDVAREEVQDDARHVRSKLDAAEAQLREEAENLHKKLDRLVEWAEGKRDQDG